MSADITTNSNGEPDRAWLKKGVLYVEYNNVVDVQAILDMMDRSMVFIKRTPTGIVPIVIIFSPSCDMSEVRISEISKIFNNHFVKHLSAVHVVAMKHGNTLFIEMASKMFLAGRVKFFDSVEEAGAAAEAFLSEDRPILEQD